MTHNSGHCKTERERGGGREGGRGREGRRGALQVWMMDGPQRNINAADLNHFKCKCLSRGVMQMRIEWKRLKLFPLLNANMFLTRWGEGGFVTYGGERWKKGR